MLSHAFLPVILHILPATLYANFEIGLGAYRASSLVGSSAIVWAPAHLSYHWHHRRDGRQRIHWAFMQAPISGQIQRARLKYQSLSWHWEKKWRLSSQFKPWWSLGIAYVRESLTHRYATDREGFLVQGLPSIHQQGLATITGINFAWHYRQQHLLSLGTHYYFPLYKGAEIISIQFMYGYLWGRQIPSE